MESREALDKAIGLLDEYVGMDDETMNPLRAALRQAGEYRVPTVLKRVREERAKSGSEPVPVAVLTPHLLWSMAWDATGGDKAMTRILYNHAFVEAGFVGEQAEPNFKAYDVCPVCGYVLA
jgi:hypothetical protein